MVKCSECGKECNDYYMVNNDVWDEFGSGRGHLHLECLVKRMGRPLAIIDFSDSVLNDNIKTGWELAMRWVDWVENDGPIV